MSLPSARCIQIVLLLLTLTAAGWAQSVIPDIRLSVGGELINQGEPYLFSDVALGAQGDAVTFTLVNLRDANLTPGRAAVSVGGKDAPMFVVVEQPPRLLPAGGAVTFLMIFIPRDPGPHIARVTIDAVGQPNPFNFLVIGNGVSGQ